MDASQKRLVLVLGGVLGVLLFCGLVIGGAFLVLRPMQSAVVSPTVDWMGTQVAATIEALAGTKTATIPSPTTPSPPTAIPDTPTSPSSGEPTSPPLATPTPPCLAARFVKDVTVPDGTEFAPNTDFVKTWRLRNVGSCTWTTAFVAYFDEGDAMGAPPQVNLPHAVEPGETVDIQVAMRAPSTPGTYKGLWKLRSDTGQSFGLGEEADRAFWVEIRVQAPEPTATPTPTPSGPVTVRIPYDPANSGTLYQDGSNTIGGSILAGDTGANVSARGYITFNLGDVRGTVTNATLTMTCSRTREPFTDLSGIWLAEVEFALPLRPLHYDITGEALTLITSLPVGPVDVTSRVAADVGSGDSYFQIRLHPKRATDGDGQADYIMCRDAVLEVTYQP